MSDHKADGGKWKCPQCGLGVDDHCPSGCYPSAPPPSEPIHWDGIGYVEPEVTPERVEGPKTEGKLYKMVKLNNRENPNVWIISVEGPGVSQLVAVAGLNENTEAYEASAEELADVLNSALATKDAEIEKLRKALEEIGMPRTASLHVNGWQLATDLANIARAALKGGK